MGIEHSFKDVDEQGSSDENKDTQRCPSCGHVSTLKAGEPTMAYGLYAGITGEYFYCQNPKCDVERIYGDNMVMVSGR